MELNEIHQNIVLDIKSNLEIVASGSPMRDIGYTFEELSTQFQVLGICQLLEYADIAEFRVNLVRSGYSKRYFLRKSEEQENTDDHHLALSRSEAFLDTIAADHLELAQEIARLSLRKWVADWEYEDDYYYYYFLHTVVIAYDNLPKTQLKSILNKFESSLEGLGSLRFEICKSILARDKENFHENFKSLLETISIAQEEKRQIVESYEYLFWPRSFISVEGFALLKIAELVGIQCIEEYPLCPNMGYLSTRRQDYLDPFMEIEKMST